jgi:hypothetical protein
LRIRKTLNGDGKACEDETGFNAVRFDGAGSHAEDTLELLETLSARAIRRYTSNKTETVTYRGISEVGVGFAESVVTQRAADRVAARIAVKMAENEIAKQLSPIISLGDTSL